VLSRITDRAAKKQIREIGSRQAFQKTTMASALFWDFTQRRMVTVLQLEHSFVRCWNLDASGSRSKNL